MIASVSEFAKFSKIPHFLLNRYGVVKGFIRINLIISENKIVLK